MGDLDDHHRRSSLPDGLDPGLFLVRPSRPEFAREFLTGIEGENSRDRNPLRKPPLSPEDVCPDWTKRGDLRWHRDRFGQLEGDLYAGSRTRAGDCPSSRVRARSAGAPRIGKTSPLFANRADKGRYVKSGAAEREAPRRDGSPALRLQWIACVPCSS